MNKKIISAALAAAVCTGVLGACGQKNQQAGGNAAEVKLNGADIYPVECEDTLTVWTNLDPRLSGSFENFGETPLAKELEKQTGVKVEYIHPQAGQEAEQFNIMLASNELPDVVIYNWSNYGGGAETAINEQYIYKLNDIIDDYAPALKSYLSENKEVDKKVKTDDGNYFAFPFVRGEDWMTCGQGLILRKDWLDKLNLKEPETLDDLEEVLKGFKTLGAKAPLAITPAQLQLILFAYGTAPGFYVDNDKVKYGPMTDEYREALKKTAQWFKEGLIDNNLVSADKKYVQSRILNEEAGAFYDYVVSGMGAVLDAKPHDAFSLTAVSQPTLSGGKPEFSYKEDNVLASCAAAITTNCKNPELAARFLDFGFTEAGHMLYNFGIEGETYNMVDGKPVFTDLIKNNPDGLTFAQASVRYTKGAYSGTFVHDPEYVRQSLTYPQEQQHAYDVWSDTNMSKHLLPPITVKTEELDEISEIMNNINTYASEKQVAYITGKEDISTFDSYLKQLEDYNIERVLECYQSALDRYNKR